MNLSKMVRAQAASQSKNDREGNDGHPVCASFQVLNAIAAILCIVSIGGAASDADAFPVDFVTPIIKIISYVSFNSTSTITIHVLTS